MSSMEKDFASLTPLAMAANIQLHDQYQREFSYLRLSITDVCNYSCNYCLPDGYQCESKPANAPLNVHEIKNLVRVFANKGIKKVRITGGEPSLRKDLSQIIEVIKQTPGITEVAMTTNGYKLAENIEGWVSAGLDILNVSIDSLDPRMFQLITGHNRLTKIMDGLAIAQTLPLKAIKVNAVLLKTYNLAEFEHFLNWIKTTPITLRFIELMETGDNRDYFAANHVSGQAIKNQLISQGWLQKQRGPHAGPAQEFSHPDYLGSIGLIMPYSTDFCKSCNRLRVSSSGKLHLCLFGDGGEDLRPLLQDASQQPLQQAIDSALMHKPAQHYLAQHQTGTTAHLAMLGG